MMLFAPAHARAQDAEEHVIRIGVLAYRGWDDASDNWQPLAGYLSARLDGETVRLVPVTLSSAALLIETGALDFLVTNPGHYLTLARSYPMSVLATRARRLSDGSRATSFGSTLVARKGSGLDSFGALRGARVAAVSPRGFGGFQTVWFEAREQGIDLLSAPSETIFLGFPMDRIVEAVLAGDADIGIVRSGLLERMAADGKIDRAALEVLDPGASYTHADAVSTRLYPEWPFLALARTDPALINAVALALLQSGDGETGLEDIWRAPVSYLAAERLLAAYGAETAPAAERAPPSVEIPPLVWITMAVSLAGIVALLLWLRSVGGLTPVAPAGPSAAEVDLTRRERQILQLVSRGLSSKEIAAELGVSPKTVEFHRSNLLRKFDVRSAAQLVSVAGEQARPAGDSGQT
ncbi:PhnD/SsuA/transferrin family substrate-binding protein [Salipiger pentaromativorans]|uniref:PhnD/SsuA/transferrin family substrate-binding protein n=1 Tax=Salipiger pentaromativorans TaxID=2943193 RepID=UPI00237CEAB6|nr:PhnD/SsuA/transferrin family substrate-binding protein [Salipiger pentaromativorans]